MTTATLYGVDADSATPAPKKRSTQRLDPTGVVIVEPVPGDTTALEESTRKGVAEMEVMVEEQPDEVAPGTRKRTP